ncbi:MAG: hypothetical protein RLZZ50_660 [Verrucomicrobiota bacterium]|jgi:gamma-glutamylcyclotransferase (GGCT)/AIG2-like uncharacterized protein YtfP
MPVGRPHLVFVYGTLKRGGSNHARMAGQIFLGAARTAPGVTLYSLGEYPGLVFSPEDRQGVEGELWTVDATTLASLDELEGVAEGLYARETALLVEWPGALTAAEAACVELYRYLRPVEAKAHIGSVWKI